MFVNLELLSGSCLLGVRKLILGHELRLCRLFVPQVSSHQFIQRFMVGIAVLLQRQAESTQHSRHNLIGGSLPKASISLGVNAEA